MSNIYDDFRGIQAKKTSCYDERSAAFITEGRVSQDITHVRLNKEIKAALVFDDEEGPDEALVYTLKEDDLNKSDYFIYDEQYYLVYEKIKRTDEDITWEKKKALECNVNFNYDSNVVYAYFNSSIRSNSKVSLKKDIALLPDQVSLLIIPTSVGLVINNELKIGSKGWKVIDYDMISNSGISYLYLERTTIEVIKNDILESHEQEPQVYDDSLPEDEKILNPMVEYEFNTQNAFFESDPEVNILKRTPTTIKFSIPFGIPYVTITVLDSSGIENTVTYKVVK